MDLLRKPVTSRAPLLSRQKVRRSEFIQMVANILCRKPPADGVAEGKETYRFRRQMEFPGGIIRRRLRDDHALNVNLIDNLSAKDLHRHLNLLRFGKRDDEVVRRTAAARIGPPAYPKIPGFGRC